MLAAVTFDLFDTVVDLHMEDLPEFSVGGQRLRGTHGFLHALVAEHSDVDLTVMVWNIHHLVSTELQPILLRESDYVYGTPAWNPVTLSEFPPLPPPPGGGTWYHVSQTKTFQKVAGLPGSAFYATLVGTARIGIEHVPEPATGLMLMGGVGSLLWGLRARRRRLSS